MVEELKAKSSLTSFLLDSNIFDTVVVGSSSGVVYNTMVLCLHMLSQGCFKWHPPLGMCRMNCETELRKSTSTQGERWIRRKGNEC